MRANTRNLIDRSFSLLGVFSIFIMVFALGFILLPILWNGSKAIFFRGTIEHRRLMLAEFGRGNSEKIEQDVRECKRVRQVVFDMMTSYEKEQDNRLNKILIDCTTLQSNAPKKLAKYIKRKLKRLSRANTLSKKLQLVQTIINGIKEKQHDKDRQSFLNVEERKIAKIKKDIVEFVELKKQLHYLFGMLPNESEPVLLHEQYGQCRWDRVQRGLHSLLYKEQWDSTDSSKLTIRKYIARVSLFKGTAIEPLFAYVKNNITKMMKPKFTIYWQFFIDKSKDSHFFGGIVAEILGTLYLTVGAILFAVPLGVIAAIYLCEYAGNNFIITVIRTCISTLAGVPSIVFGLFGLAFFLGTIKVSDSKSVLAGALTLSLMILPTIIRASEEAIRAVPNTYREAALGLGAGRWHTIITVIIPAALPGILTGVVLSMGRAAGETAPIIFTAAVCTGRALNPMQIFSQPTPALPWSIYTICSEHTEAAEVTHIQYGMVFTLIALVLLLNLIAIIMRAKISKKLHQ